MSWQSLASESHYQTAIHIRDAEAEMNKKATTHALSWDEVFTMVYRLEF